MLPPKMGLLSWRVHYVSVSNYEDYYYSYEDYYYRAAGRKTTRRRTQSTPERYMFHANAIDVQ